MEKNPQQPPGMSENQPIIFRPCFCWIDGTIHTELPGWRKLFLEHGETFCRQQLHSKDIHNVNPGLINPYSDYQEGGTPKSDKSPLKWDPPNQTTMGFINPGSTLIYSKINSRLKKKQTEISLLTESPSSKIQWEQTLGPWKFDSDSWIALRTIIQNPYNQLVVYLKGSTGSMYMFPSYFPSTCRPMLGPWRSRAKFQLPAAWNNGETMSSQPNEVNPYFCWVSGAWKKH